MAYPKEQEHVEYLDYVRQWSMGEGPYSQGAKMSKEEWLKRRKKEDEEDSRQPTILESKS